MIYKIRHANTRGIVKNNWIESRRTFSNNDYWNPRYMNWGPVKVINDDTLQPGHIVPNHQHRNYDILGYIVDGELEHVDSLGNTVSASSSHAQHTIQHMWCGNSIWHTEQCISTVAARYLQIWITPKEQYRDTKPYYECVTKSPEFGDIPVKFHQDIRIRAGLLNGQHHYSIERAYLYVVNGSVEFDGTVLHSGDGAEVYNCDFSANYSGHFILFEPLG